MTRPPIPPHFLSGMFAGWRGRALSWPAHCLPAVSPYPWRPALAAPAQIGFPGIASLLLIGQTLASPASTWQPDPRAGHRNTRSMNV